MTPWASELLLILLAVCAGLITALPRLGPRKQPPLDTTHDWRDLPEWLPFYEPGRAEPRRKPEKSSP